MPHAPLEAPPFGSGPAVPAAAGRPARLGRRLREEVARIAAIFAYLVVVFGVLVLHETVVLSRHGIGYHFYGFALVNSWILAKVMLVAEGVAARRPARRSPLVRIAARACGFALLLVCAYALEETLIGLVKGRSLAGSLPMIGGGGLRGLAAVTVIMAVALVPYFTWRELGRLIGRDRLRALVLSGAGPEAPPGPRGG
ncbi:hypothetical protein [Methylobacterium sp. 17Sr1-1]|uniref:hypothetical protein n=1 Tax=Methylobacterium sp. 17Sr1-1 TaxID=2202826 RepID=UPI000D6F1088|nr:hypothetical protein [Methylobacterium sp. 17Sr1-1]AWN55401.1 hypothetical protein DK412_04365 [Methylobacterium sp. 17Sr1-1]